MKYIFLIFFSFISSCKKKENLYMKEARIPSCAVEQDSDYSAIGSAASVKFTISKTCWPIFVDTLSNVGGEWCKKNINNGDGCSYEYNGREFLLGTQRFISTDKDDYLVDREYTLIKLGDLNPKDYVGIK